MPRKIQFAAAALLALGLASAASARPGDWGNPGWGSSGSWGASDWANSRWNNPRSNPNGRDDREGKVDAASFVASGDAARALGHGKIAVQLADQPASTDNASQDFLGRNPAPPAIAGASYEAAVVDQMVHAGYDTTGAQGSEDQVVELRITRNVLVPAETKHKPVSGEVEMGVSNRGSMMGAALNLDFSKPKKALVSTKMEARIRDKASGNVLWEGHADIATRDGDDEWGDGAIATKLAEELFKRFPGSTEHPYG